MCVQIAQIWRKIMNIKSKKAAEEAAALVDFGIGAEAGGAGAAIAGGAIPAKSRARRTGGRRGRRPRHGIAPRGRTQRRLLKWSTAAVLVRITNCPRNPPTVPIN